MFHKDDLLRKLTRINEIILLKIMEIPDEKISKFIS